MNSIDNITDDANQLITVVLDDGTNVLLNLVYRPAVQRWTVDVAHGTFIVNGINITVNPNFMREWRNVIPFGLGCTTTDGGDPVYLEDFVNGRATLHILTAADVAAIESTYLGAGVA